MPVSIRFATDTDLPRIEEIEQAADVRFDDWFHTQTGMVATPSRSRAAQPGFILVALPDGADPAASPAGFAHVLAHGELAWLDQVSVLPACARRGIGRDLVRAALVEARRRGCLRMSLRTFAEVPWNAPFYRGSGFTECVPEHEFELRRAREDAKLDALGRRIQMSFPL